MPFRRSLRPIKSDKHENTWSNLGQNASTVQTVTIAQGTVSADKNSATEVEIGSRVNSIYFEFHFSPAQTGNANVVHWEILIYPSGLTPPAPNVYYQTNRSMIIKRGMEMLPVNVATVFKRIFVVKIPNSKRRMTDGSIIQFRYIASSTQTINACGIAIYKEFY